MDEIKRLRHEINLLQQELTRQNSELAGMNADYEGLLKHVKKNEELLIQKNKELEELAKKIHNEISERNQGNSNEAAEYLRNAEKILRDIDKKPHEKFLPKRFSIFQNSLKDGRQLFRAGLFEAASAVAVSTRSGLERLGYNIDDKVEEWEKIFSEFSQKLENLREKINHEISEWGNLINNHIRAEIIIAVNYWSKGEFIKIIDISKKYREIVKALSQIGKEEYIKSLESPSIEDIKKFIVEIEEADKKISDFSELYKKRYSTSCERSEWGENIIDFMTTEINFVYVDELTGYKTASDETLTSKDYAEYMKQNFNGKNINQDFREWLRIVFANSSNDNIYVYIIPVETDKTVDNHVILYIDYNGAENEIYSRDVYNHVCEALNLDSETVDYTRDINDLKVNSNKSYRETGIDIEKMKSKKER